MSQPQWDDEMKFELLRLKSELKLESIQVLATPLGLGQLIEEPVSRESALFPSSPPPVISDFAIQSSVLVGAPPIAMRPLASSKATSAPLQNWKQFPESEPVLQEGSSLGLLPKWQKFYRFLLVHMLDLLFVGASLGLGLLMLTWIVDPQHFSFNRDVLAQASPVVVLQNIRLWALVLGLYLVFTLYWLFFRIVSGQTLGETFMHSFTQPKEDLAGIPDKDSEKT